MHFLFNVAIHNGKNNSLHSDRSAALDSSIDRGIVHLFIGPAFLIRYFCTGSETYELVLLPAAPPPLPFISRVIFLIVSLGLAVNLPAHCCRRHGGRVVIHRKFWQNVFSLILRFCGGTASNPSPPLLFLDHPRQPCGAVRALASRVTQMRIFGELAATLRCGGRLRLNHGQRVQEGLQVRF
jgi:hypothetical protein